MPPYRRNERFREFITSPEHFCTTRWTIVLQTGGRSLSIMVRLTANENCATRLHSRRQLVNDNFCR